MSESQLSEILHLVWVLRLLLCPDDLDPVQARVECLLLTDTAWKSKVSGSL